MLKDFFVRSFSNRQIHNFVAEWRARNGVGDAIKVDIVSCLQAGWVWTLKGQKKLEIQVLDDEILGSDDALSISRKESALIKIKRSVWKSAKEAVGTDCVSASAARGRFTLAHELGHVVLCHEKAPMARGSGVNASTSRPQSIPKYESAEHQANVFAAAALVRVDLLSVADTAEEVSARFGVSLQVAVICLEQLPRKSSLIINGFKELRKTLSATPPRSEPTRAALRGNSPANPGVASHAGSASKSGAHSQASAGPQAGAGSHADFASHANSASSQPLQTGYQCPVCGEYAVHSLGNKDGCGKCGSKGNLHQDGDTLSDYEF
jgi:hypothetical protein